MPLAMKPVSPYLLARKYFFPMLNPNMMMLHSNFTNKNSNNICEQGITPTGEEDEDEETPD